VHKDNFTVTIMDRYPSSRYFVLRITTYC